MKKNPIGAILVAGLFLSSLLSIGLAISYLITVQRTERLRGEVLRINSTMNLMQSIANEAILYSRTNPAIDPILVQYGLKPRPGTNAPGAPNALPTIRTLP